MANVMSERVEAVEAAIAELKKEVAALKAGSSAPKVFGSSKTSD